MLAQLGLIGPILPGPRVINSKDQFSARKHLEEEKKLSSLAVIFPFPLLSVISSTEATSWEEQNLPKPEPAWGLRLVLPCKSPVLLMVSVMLSLGHS